LSKTAEKSSGEKIRIKYYECNMTKQQHLLAYLAFAAAIVVILFIYYRLLPLAVAGGLLIAIPQEKNYSKSVMRKRQNRLRLQFKDFLESMSVAVRAGNVEVKAVESALKDLKLSYNARADIVREVENILLQYEKGGIELKVLFQDLAARSDIEDIRSFAAIYAVIEGKSDRFGDILRETEQIIGDKLEIEQEIETTITSAKSETMMMLIMPIVIVAVMSGMGEFFDSLFTTPSGRVAATVALLIFGLSFVLAVKSTDIEV